MHHQARATGGSERADATRGLPSTSPLHGGSLLSIPGARAGDHEPAAARTRVVELLEALQGRAHGRHVVLIRGYPDPDSLASAWAHVQLAALVGVSCDIAHMPLLSRAENRAMVNLLELPLIRLSSPAELERYVALSLVDTNAIELPKSVKLPCVSIVDHHSVSGKLDADFVDIRANVGATSTIYTEYLWESPTSAIPQGDLLPRLATALAYGIRSDTDDLLRATAMDLRALSDLIEHLDRDVLASLAHYAIPASSMSILRRALDAMRIEGTWAFAGVGSVRPEDRDAIGQAADFLLRREGLKTVLVFGLIDGTIDGSLRTTDMALDPAVWLRDAFGMGPRDLPYGGGRRGKGGFQIPLGPLSLCPNEAALWGVCKEMVEATIRKRIGVAAAEVPAGGEPES